MFDKSPKKLAKPGHI